MQSDPKNEDGDKALEENESPVSEAEETVVMPEETVVMPEETVVMSDDAFAENLGDVSAEINIEKLVAKVEAADDDEVARKKAIRQRLEEIAEEKGFEETYAVDFEKD